MKIGLLDVDSHNFPNLPLMKLSSWHKTQGHSVEMMTPENRFKTYDRVYCSKVFEFSADYDFNIMADEVIHGGTGYAYYRGKYRPDLDEPLPAEVEAMHPDYNLYGIKDTAFGFLTRGCPRGCGFCIVGEKEGRCSRKVANLLQFCGGQKYVKLLDPNLMACKEHMDLLDQLADGKASIDFTQGLDVRLINQPELDALKRLRIKTVHFAWDDPDDIETLRKLKWVHEETGWDCNRNKVGVYILTNYNSTLVQDWKRVQAVAEIGFNPYVMIYDKYNAPLKIRRLQGWVNNRPIFWSNPRTPFHEFAKGRQRRETSP